METGFSFASVCVTLFLVMDPFGNLPFVLAILKDVDHGEYRRTILREVAVAYLVLLFFAITGKWMFVLLHVSTAALSIAGGLVLLLIALKMVFSDSSRIFEGGGGVTNRFFLVPIAVPSIAGPSAIATVSLLRAQEALGPVSLAAALTLAVIATGLPLFFGVFLRKIIGVGVLAAMARLMGLLLVVIAVEMLLAGIRTALPGIS